MPCAAPRSAAFKVSVRDDFPPSHFQVLEGAPTAFFAALEPAAVASFNLTLVPKVAGVLTVGRAVVEYRYKLPAEELGDEEEDEAGSEDVFADVKANSSADAGRVDILRPEVYTQIIKQRLPTAVFALIAAALLTMGPYSRFHAAAKENAAAGIPSKKRS